MKIPPKQDKSIAFEILELKKIIVFKTQRSKMINN